MAFRLSYVSESTLCQNYSISWGCSAYNSTHIFLFMYCYCRINMKWQSGNWWNESITISISMQMFIKVSSDVSVGGEEGLTCSDKSIGIRNGLVRRMSDTNVLFTLSESHSLIKSWTIYELKFKKSSKHVFAFTLLLSMCIWCCLYHLG